MFVLAEQHQFDWPVRVRVPQDGGTHQVQGFTARFRLLPAKRAAQLLGDHRALISEALVGWQGIQDACGGLLQDTADTRAALLDVPYVLAALAEAYADALSGKAAEKN